MQNPLEFILWTQAVITATLGYHFHFKDGEIQAQLC